MSAIRQPVPVLAGARDEARPPLSTTHHGERSVSGWLRLTFGVDGRGVTLVHAERAAPLHLQRLLYLDGRAPSLARAVILNSTAGLFAGDRLALDVRVTGGAALELTTPAMTRVFAMPQGAAVVETRLIVETGGYLESLPEPTLLCRGASLDQTTVIEVAAGATLAHGEALSFGRQAAGELHAYRALRQRLTLTHAGRVILADALSLSAETEPPALGALSDAAALGSLVLLCGTCDGAALLAQTRAVVSAALHVWSGASLLSGGSGVAVRTLGESGHAAQAALRAVVDGFRQCHGPAAPAPHDTSTPGSHG